MFSTVGDIINTAGDWRIFSSVEDAQYCLEIPSVLWRDIINTLEGHHLALWEDTISTVGGCHQYSSGIKSIL